ncbi:MAG TPA: S8 family serine peptidase, partial [Blastocatellia bacterium]|nr:S8 family serine peptidase [Blastocatellia bacterium]
HVDGTSFAAPIVSSIVAQMLEAVPDLKPHEVKYALIKTASRISHIDVDRQGWGRVNPRAAIHAAIVLRAERRKQEKKPSPRPKRPIPHRRQVSRM